MAADQPLIEEIRLFNIKKLTPFFLLTVMVAVLWSSLVWGRSVQPATSWLVNSEYLNPLAGNRVSRISWRFSRFDCDGDCYRLEVKDSDERVGSWGELHFDRENKLTRFVGFRIVREKVVEDVFTFDPRKPAVVQQSLIPGSWLNVEVPFHFNSASKKYSVKGAISPARFVTHLRLQEREIGIAEAHELGLLNETNRAAAKGKSLYLVEIFRSRGKTASAEPVLRQLWSESGTFWLYEEQGTRRSWRVAK